MLAHRPGDAYFPEQDITAAIFALGFTATDPVATCEEAWKRLVKIASRWA